MNMYGTFIVFGTERAPEVHMLGKTQMNYFDEGCRIARCRSSDPEQARTRVYEEIFGKGAEIALPAWMLQTLEFVVENYEGPHAERVIELAKHLACSVPYGPDEKRPGEGGVDGGQKVPIDPVKPRPRKPSGGAQAKVSRSEQRAERRVRQIEAAQV